MRSLVILLCSVLAACNAGPGPDRAAITTRSPETPGASIPYHDVYWGEEIETGDAERFRDMVFPGAVVRFNSPGGKLVEATKMGRHMRDVGARAIVAEGEMCNSACAFVLLGSPSVDIDPNALIGVHRSKSGREETRQLLLAYATEVNPRHGEDFVNRTWRVPQETGENLSARERRKYFNVRFGLF